MSQRTLSMKESFSFGFSSFFSNWALFIGVLAIMMAVQLPLSYLNDTLKTAVFGNGLVVTFLLIILLSAISIINYIGFISISLQCCDNKKPVIGELFSKSELLIKMIWSSLLYFFYTSIIPIVLLIVAAFCLFFFKSIIITAIFAIMSAAIWGYYMIRFNYFKYLLIDTGINGMESMKKSWEITEQAFLQIAYFLSVVFLINIIGFFLLFVGLIVTIPATSIASAHFYRQLLAAQ